MAEWQNGQIEGVNVLKVIPRPTALRAVGKNRKSRPHLQCGTWMLLDFLTVVNLF
jgi:hypothetical protein